MLAYLDGCPDDAVAEAAVSRWHTFAFVLAGGAVDVTSDDGDPLQRVAGILRERGLVLHKWSRSKAKHYRSRFRRVFPEVVASGHIIPIAASFTGTDARLAMPGLLASLGLDELSSAYAVNGRNRMKVGPFVRRGKENYFFDVTQNELAPLLVLADIIAGTFRMVANAGLSAGHANPGLVVFCDLLSGDQPAERRKLEFVQHAVRRMPGYSGVMLRSNPVRAPHVGDLLADNVAGWLNGVAGSPTSKTVDDVRRAMDGAASDSFQWWTYSVLEKEAMMLKLTSALEAG